MLSDYAQIRYAYGDIQTQTVLNREGNHFLLVNVGWDERRIHGVLVHIDIVAGKCWIQRDGTEHGIATDLVAAGVPKSDIVLAFCPPEVRRQGEFAVSER